MAGNLYKRQQQTSRFSFYGLGLILLGICMSGMAAFTLHPYYMSVTELDYKPAEKEIQISSRIFIDDLEYALAEEFKTKVEILKAADKTRNEGLLNLFFQKHLKISVEGKPVAFELIGFDREEEAIWTYLVIKNVKQFKKATVFTDLLYGFRQDQINIIHFKNNQDRLSHRFTFPDNQFTFSW